MKAQQPTMHCQKLGQDIVTSATNQYHLWFGAGLILKNFSIILYSRSKSSLPPGRRISKPQPSAMQNVSGYFMKTLLFILTFFSSALVVGQNPYARLNNEFRNLFDPVPVDKGQEQYFFDYASKLYKEDSLQKAGEIFDRIYWLDTASTIGKQALLYRNIIEKFVTQQTQTNLNSVWNWNWSGTNWGPSDSPHKSRETKRVELNGTIIKFYRNDTLIRQTNYVLTQTFNWQYGFLTNHIRYLDNNEEWYFNLTNIGEFTSDRLWIEKVSEQVCGNYGECYLLKNPNQLLSKNSR